MAGRQQIQTITLTTGQEKYIRANYGRMSVGEMCRNIGITEYMYFQNRPLLNLTSKRSHKARIPFFHTPEGYFNVEQYLKELVTV